MLKLNICAALIAVGVFMMAPGIQFAWSAYGYGGPRFVITDDVDAYIGSLAIRAAVGALALVGAVVFFARRTARR
jgi:hypothetical protein